MTGYHGRMSYTQKGEYVAPQLSVPVFEREVLPGIEKFMLPKSQGILIDIGCGNGRLNTILHKYYDKVLCVDYNESELNEKFRYDNCEFIKDGLMTFSPGEKVDCVLFYASFYIMNPYGRSLERCHEFLKDDGIVIICDNKDRNSKKIKKDGWYDLEQLSADHGFEIQHSFVQENQLLGVNILQRRSRR